MVAPPGLLESPHRPLGATLRAHLHTETAVGPVGDRKVTDAWARELGMGDWYEWRIVDDV